jgi:hypothetical protein
VGENESLNEVTQDGQDVASTGISRWQRGQFIGGGLYQDSSGHWFIVSMSQ